MQIIKPVEAQQWNERLENISRYLENLEGFRRQIERDIELLRRQMAQHDDQSNAEPLVIKLSVHGQLEHEEKLARQLLEHVEAECSRLGIAVTGLAHVGNDFPKQTGTHSFQPSYS